MLLPTFVFLLFSTLSLAAPSPPNLVYPLQDQRPPVARVNQTWSWTLLPGTFNSSSGTTLSLSSRSLPSWASFDAATYTFSGMPGTGDEGARYVTVQANASGVATGTTSGFQLLVVTTPKAYVNTSIASQLPSASSLGGGATYTPDGALIVPPQWSFSLGFQQYTFQTTNYRKIYYTSYQTDTTELPSWLNFDNNTVTFDGVAPATTGEYSFTVFGSDYFGYGDVTQTFKLSVGYHSFELLGGSLPALNTTPSDPVNYTISTSNLRVDNTTVGLSNLTVAVNLSNYTYLSYNKASGVISGTIPSSLAPSTYPIPVTFTDFYNDTLVTNITMNVVSSLFTNSTLPVLSVLPGQKFNESLKSYATSNVANYSAVISPASAQSWLTFDPKSLLLSGTAPSTVQNASVALTAVDSATGVDSVASLIVAVKSKTSSSTSGTAAPTSTSSPSSHHSGLSHAAKLGIGLTFGILGALILLVLLGVCCRRYLSDEKRVRRSESTFQFDQATIAAAQRASPGVSSGKTTLVSTFEKQQKDDEKGGRKSIVEDSGAQRDAATAMAGQRPAPTTPSKPRRLNLMAMFGMGTPKRDVSEISLPIPQRTQSELFGLGIGDSPNRNRHNIVVVTDTGRTGTYVPGPERSVSGGGGGGDMERVSSWESAGSSSLWYSDDPTSSQNRSRGPTRAPSTEPPSSSPRRRRDFLPLPIRTVADSPTPYRAVPRSPTSPTPSASSSLSPSPTREGGIRLVGSPSGFTDASSSRSDLLAETASPHRAYPPYMPSEDSSESLPPPQLIPFRNQRTVSQTESDRRISHVAARNDDAVEDADEDAQEDPFSSDPNRRSALYVPPPTEGSPTMSAVFFSTPKHVADEQDPWGRSPAFSEYGDENVRLVPSVAGSPNPSTGSWAQGHRRTATASSYGEAMRVPVLAGQIVKFTPPMNPPPFVAIMSSPGRGGPPKTEYLALLDTPDSPETDRKPLPAWLRFDTTRFELWGMCPPTASGVIHGMIIERKAMQVPGSPSRHGRNKSTEEEQEQVVGRFTVEISPQSDDDEGELQIITY
ncbi:hypothetical protein MNV49_006236 [Pseudohyphozyma bogoriensis]|nr:hypothetical protein MNV49_006236 [Pseudohyphozyma bogoriensis]